jgi:hypothetical protein
MRLLKLELRFVAKRVAFFVGQEPSDQTLRDKQVGAKRGLT